MAHELAELRYAGLSLVPHLWVLFSGSMPFVSARRWRRGKTQIESQMAYSSKF